MTFGSTAEASRADQVDGVEVLVPPPRRTRSSADVLRLLVGLGLLGLGLVVATWGRRTVRGFEADVLVLWARLPDRLEEAFTGAVWFLAGALPVLAVAGLVVRRRFGRAATLVVAANLASLLTVVMGSLLEDRGVVEAVEARLDDPTEVTVGGVAGSPMVASTVAMVVVASSWLSQRWRRVLWGGVGLLTVVRILSAGPPLDVGVAIAVGLAVGSLALLAVGVPSADPDGPALVRLLRQAGDPVRITQTTRTRPLTYLVEMRSGLTLDLRLWTGQDRSTDLLERLWRFARMRSSETDRPFSTLARRVEHEALALTMATKAGARARDVHAVVGSPDGAVGLLLVHPRAVPAGDDHEVTPGMLDDLWRQVSALHRAHIAHRDLVLEHVTLAADGGVVLDGFGRSRLAASDRDLALDTAQLLVGTALRRGSTTALRAALEARGRDAVTAAVPFLQPLALPYATRRALRSEREVLDELRQGIQETTGVEPAPLERLDRIPPRTALSVVALTVAFYLLLPQLAQADDTAAAVSDAHWWWLVPVLVGSASTYVGATVAFVATAPGPMRLWPAWRLQVASSFLNQVAPANVGGFAGAVRFLQRAGFEPGAATAAVALGNVAGLAVHLVLTVAFLTWTGTSGVGMFSLPDADTVLLVLALAASVGGLVGLVRPLRRRVVPPVLRQARAATTTLTSVMTDPRRLLGLVGGSTWVTLSYLVTLVAAVEAFGGGLSLPQVGSAYLVGSALASTAPTPGGLGAVEAALIAGLTGYGLLDSSAIPAVLTFRLATFWLPMLPGWILFHRMQRHGEL